PQAAFPALAAPQPFPMLPVPVTFAQRVPRNQAEVEWNGTWWAAEVVRTSGDRYYIHYTGWANSWDEWVGPDRIRMPVARQGAFNRTGRQPIAVSVSQASPGAYVASAGLRTAPLPLRQRLGGTP